ncbi:hypothetical protein [Peribacillus frigoritolerans]|uniref:hypothetical protein n=1 Tax=Peribacillus frigoritolerans TaxID=450367 RepID=UPI002E1B6CC9|nr:hypothetical protein [Peribacillus frigoritolerans]
MQIISLLNLLEATTEEVEVSEYLSSFSCEINKDVESFLHRNAIENEKRAFTRTFLVIDEELQGDILGYFTLKVKEFYFLDDISKTKRKLVSNNKNADGFNSLLIAQLGRSDNYKGVVKGKEILGLALQNCELIHDLIALGLVCVEFDPDPKLIDFYESQDFKILQQNPETNKLLAYIRL